MSAEDDYWSECIADAAESCGLELTAEQRKCLVESVQAAHENYGMAFYSPPSSDRLDSINSEWEAQFRRLQAEFDADKERRIQWAINEDQLPWPGMMTAFENYYGQSWFDRDWRAESSTWAAAWKAAKRHGAQPAPIIPEAVMEVIAGLVYEVERNVCTHEETHRGGFLWEICDMCGARWADDMGGKPEFKWPEIVEKARDMLAAATEAKR